MPELLPTLHELGAPGKFSKWYANQTEAIARAIDSPKRFVALCMPTGAGKSAVAIGRAVMAGARTVYLTSTKGLQNQILQDFAALGLVDVRGQDNYECLAARDFDYPTGTTVSGAPCHAGVTCGIKESSCSYFKAVREAKSSRLVVTNYTYWMLQNMFGDGLGTFDLMVCDEAHEAVQEVCSVLSTTIHKFEAEAILHSTLPSHHSKQEEWSKWALILWKRVDSEIEDIRVSIRENIDEGNTSTARQLSKRLRERKDLARRLNTLAEAKGEWVTEMHTTSMTWDPVWPQEYAEEMLFWHTPHILLMSATIRPKTLDLLGVLPEQYDFVEYPSTFPKERRPVYRVPTVRLNKDTDEAGYRTWLQRIDQIIGPRLSRKGIIHTVSYKRTQLVTENSEYHAHMMTHNSKNTKNVVEAFKKSDPPAILVSPSMDTGWDYPNDEVRWMIVGKLPWPDTRPVVMKARKDRDPEYMSYLTMQALVQMSGRAMRHEKDWAEVIVIDDSLGWFLKQHGEFAPKWFREAIKWVSTIPEPLKF